VRISGEYLVGADGARSTVRKAIGGTFDGFTYDKMVVATNVFYPFREHGFAAGQFIIHPEHFAMVSYPFPCGLSFRLARFLQMGCTEFHMARTRRYRTTKHEPISIINSTPSSLAPNPSSTIYACFHHTNSINVGQTSSVWDESYSLEMPPMHAIRSVGWD